MFPSKQIGIFDRRLLGRRLYPTGHLCVRDRRKTSCEFAQLRFANAMLAMILTTATVFELLLNFSLRTPLLELYIVQSPFFKMQICAFLRCNYACSAAADIFSDLDYVGSFFVYYIHIGNSRPTYSLQNDSGNNSLRSDAQNFVAVVWLLAVQQGAFLNFFPVPVAYSQESIADAFKKWVCGHALSL